MTGQPFLSFLGVPCHAPPYGTITAIDLHQRRIAWQVPMGTVQDTGPLGLRTGLQIPVGMPTLGGTMTTASGIVFFAGTQDYYLRALDARSGKELWKGRLPVGSQATPMTYVSPRCGRQFIVVSAGGARNSTDTLQPGKRARRRSRAKMVGTSTMRTSRRSPDSRPRAIRASSLSSCSSGRSRSSSERSPQ